MVRFRRKKSVVEWEDTADDMFSIETTLEASIQALNLASTKAALDGDAENLTAAAHGWMRLTETIHTISQVVKAEREEAELNNGGSPQQTGFGFRAPEHPEPAKIDEDEPLAGR